jgi:hypothetical protein
VRAAELAQRSLALGEAAELFRRAVEVADLLDPPDPHLRLSLSIRLGEALQGASIPGWRHVLLEAASTARAMDDAAALAEVGWALVRYGGPSNPGATDHEFTAIMEEALIALGPEPSAARARTLATLSEDRCFADPETAAAMVDEARQIAYGLDDQVTLGHVLLSYRIAARSPDNDDARHPIADELIEVGHRTGEVIFTVLGLCHRAWSHREEGALTAGDAALDAAVALQGDRVLPPLFVVAVQLFRAARATVSGDLATAEQLAEGVWAASGEGFDPTNWYSPAILMIRHAEGRLPDLVPMLEVASDQLAIGETYRCALATAYAEAGQLDEARAILDAFAADDFAAVPRNFTWLAGMAGLGEAAEWVRDPDLAAALTRLLTPYSGRVADLPQALVAPVDLVLAQLAMAEGDPARAEQLAHRASLASRNHGATVFLGRELVRVAAARAALGRTGDDIAAPLDEALAIADATGAALIRREAERYGLTK